MDSQSARPRDRRPPSRRIADDLRTQIQTAAFPPGAQLPSERDLAARYGSARNTAREAIRLLTDEGLVIAEHGRGAFVRRIGPLLRLGNNRYSPASRDAGLSPFLRECAEQGKCGRFEVISIERVQPDAVIADTLEVSPRTKSVLRRENVFWADDDPVHRVTTYIPWTIARRSALLQPEVGHAFGIHGVLEDLGYPMARLSEQVTGRMPTPDERQRLQLPPGVPVLDVLHTSVDPHRIPFELTRFVMRADMTALLYDVPVE